MVKRSITVCQPACANCLRSAGSVASLFKGLVSHVADDWRHGVHQGTKRLAPAVLVRDHRNRFDRPAELAQMILPCGQLFGCQSPHLRHQVKLGQAG